MDKEKLIYYRKKLGLTQKELAQLLAISIKAVHSYEQGWRNIPENVERQLFFLIFRLKNDLRKPRPCWLIKTCPPERKKQCPAWKFKSGHLCWFISGTLCHGVAYRSWHEKIQICLGCEVFSHISDY